MVMPTDLARLPDPLTAVKRLPHGAVVILRDRDNPDRRDWAVQLRAATSERGQFLLIANDPVLARDVDADGLHLSEADVGILRPWRLTSAAAHSMEAVRRAERWGADLLLISPVFPTASHPGGPVLGLQRARAIASGARLPAVAMGGVTPRNAACLGPAFAGFAAIGAFA